MTRKKKTSPAVLVIGGTEEQRAWTAAVARDLAPNVECHARLDDATPLEELDLVVAHYDGLHGRDRRRLFEEADRSDATAPRLLLISAATHDHEPFLREIARHKLGNLLALDREPTGDDLRVTLEKLLSTDIFGLDKYFATGVDKTVVPIHASSDVASAVESATKLATTWGVHPRLIENTVTVVDELITNALYNAPVDADGAHRFAHLPRTEPVELEADEQVVLELCCDGRRLGISVTDQFGSLTRDQSLDYMVRCLREQNKKPVSNKGGAGLGLYITFGSVNHMILNICRGKRTEVIGLIDVRGSYRDFAARGKSFNIFHCTRK